MKKLLIAIAVLVALGIGLGLYRQATVWLQKWGEEVWNKKKA